jgi:phosphoribosylformylglycinamidine synthase
MKAAMILFPGSNCEQESLAYLGQVYGPEQVKEIWHQDRFDPKGIDVVFLPGGFSYGDYVRAGACAARSAAMQDVRAHAKRGGFVVGICNGFQILLECGLLPGVLIRTPQNRFDCRWIQVENNPQTLLKWAPRKWLGAKLPIANTFGRYYLPPAYHLKDENQVVMRYSLANDNGSTHRAAGICNLEGTILGVMPHPERAFAPWHESQDGLGYLPR